QMVGGMEQPRAGRHRHGYAALIEKAEKVQRTPLGAHWILCELSLYMQCAALVKMREGKSRAKGIGQDTPRILGGSPKNVQMHVRRHFETEFGAGIEEGGAEDCFRVDQRAIHVEHDGFDRFRP